MSGLLIKKTMNFLQREWNRIARHAITCVRDLVEKVQCRGMVTLEVGCWTGVTTSFYADVVWNNHGHVLVLDTFGGNEGAKGQHAATQDGDRIEEQFLHNMTSRGFGPVTSILRMDSHQGLKLIAPHSLSLCFIDADHRYAHVSQDIDLATSLIRPGGILCGHDYDQSWRECKMIMDREGPDCLNQDAVDGIHVGVSKAVDERFSPAKLNVIKKAAVWWVQL